MMIIYFVYFIFAFALGYFLFNLYLKKKIKKIKPSKEDYYVGNKITPTGAGIIFLILFFIGTCNFYIFDNTFKNSLPNKFYMFYLCAFLFSIISFRDDMKSIDPKIRLIIQFFLVYISTTNVNFLEIDVPLKVGMLLVIITWIYIINITNFYDGLDGLLTSSSIFIFFGIIIINNFYGVKFFSFYLSIILLPILLVFMIFNKPIARLYMGDSGSIFLGYLIGFSVIELFINGFYFLAISIYIYPLLDCTITLLKKTYKGYYPWARLFDYYFLAPVVLDKREHSYVLTISTIFNALNLISIILQLYISKYFFIVTILLAVLQLLIFNKRVNYKKV